jgi:hypothetical protein
MQLKSIFTSKLNHQASFPWRLIFLMRRYVMLSAIGLMLSLGLYACGESKVSQCNKIVTVVSKFKDASLPKDLAGLNTVAANIDQSRVDIQALAIQDQNIKGVQELLAKIYDDASQAIKAQAKAIEAKDKSALAKAKQDLQAVAVKETELVDRFNGLCTN